jgi:hypothetical protein
VDQSSANESRINFYKALRSVKANIMPLLQDWLLAGQKGNTPVTTIRWIPS